MRRLLILSNRLLVTVTEENGKILVNPSSGGLITGLGAYLSTLQNADYLWIGWPGGSAYSDEGAVKDILSRDYNCVPVFVEEKAMDRFYGGFCNKTIWPLFHYFPQLTVYEEKMWENYKEVNVVFARALVDIYRPGDVIWVQDYHLMLAPGLIRQELPDAAIGFFLHVPFPSYEMFRLLPRKWGKEILSGLLAADLIGFHTYEYTQHFLRCVLRILGYSHDLGVLALEDKLAKAATFPMGIDFAKYNKAVDLGGVKKERSALRESLRQLKVIFSVDRQDYTKGILKRLEGYELFLRDNPQWHRKVVLIMVVVPSRIGLEYYQKEKDVINQLVGRINGDYGNIHWTPVIYQYKAVPFEQLVALYNLSDVGLVTPLRDGMNLVAKEYVAARKERKGVLILSENAGAAAELGEALIINPNSREEIAEAIRSALEMPENEQAKRVATMQEKLKKHDVIDWARSFLEELENMKEEEKKYRTAPLDGEELQGLFERFQGAGKKVLFLDYDGTLVPFADKPSDAAPGKRLRRIIRALSRVPETDVVIISGRNRRDLEGWYGGLGIALVAEHGVWIRRPGEEWLMPKPLENGWKPGIIKILKNYRDRLPESFIEEKDYSLVWHFSNSDDALSELRIREFVDDMVQFTARNEIEVLKGRRSVELKCSGVSKGEAAKFLLADRKYDFIMAAGDDDTDESLFQALPQGSYTIKVGRQRSFAEFHLGSSADLLDILRRMTGVRKGLLRRIWEYFRR